MCRLFGYVSRSPVTFETAVGTALTEFVDLSTKHADGWGVAQIDRNGQARVLRKTEPARQSSELSALAHHSAADGAILHLRWATPGLPICAQNTHPFVRGAFAFMHNGAISNSIDALVPANLVSL